MASHTASSADPGAVTGDAGDQPGAVPILTDAPTMDELPVDQGTGEPTGLIYHDTTDNTTKIAMPDGSGSVATADLIDLSASVSLGIGDSTGLL